MKLFITSIKKIKFITLIILMFGFLEITCIDKKQESKVKEFFQKYRTFKVGCITGVSCLAIYCVYKFKILNEIEAKCCYQILKNKPAIILK